MTTAFGLATLISTPIVPGRIHRVGFGWINVGGQRYEHDRILLPTGISGAWWRSRRHWFDAGEATDLCREFEPDIVVLGIGWMGMLQVEPAAVEIIRQSGAALEICRTPEAVRRVQFLHAEGRRIVAPLHLTC
jgi:hypothetical protein